MGNCSSDTNVISIPKLTDNELLLLESLDPYIVHMNKDELIKTGKHLNDIKHPEDILRFPHVCVFLKYLIQYIAYKENIYKNQKLINAYITFENIQQLKNETDIFKINMYIKRLSTELQTCLS